MFNIPDAYKLDYQVNLKDFIPKVLKSKDKNRIKKAIKNVKLEYQIIGEERLYNFMIWKWKILKNQIILQIFTKIL